MLSSLYILSIILIQIITSYVYTYNLAKLFSRLTLSFVSAQIIIIIRAYYYSAWIRRVFVDRLRKLTHVIMDRFFCHHRWKCRLYSWCEENESCVRTQVRIGPSTGGHS